MSACLSATILAAGNKDGLTARAPSSWGEERGEIETLSQMARRDRRDSSTRNKRHRALAGPTRKHFGIQPPALAYRSGGLFDGIAAEDLLLGLFPCRLAISSWTVSMPVLRDWPFSPREPSLYVDDTASSGPPRRPCPTPVPCAGASASVSQQAHFLDTMGILVGHLLSFARRFLFADGRCTTGLHWTGKATIGAGRQEPRAPREADI